MVALLDPKNLSLGAYTRQQAGYLARLRPQTLSRWFQGDEDVNPAIRLAMPPNEEGLVSFIDLVQLIGVREIRQHKSLSLQKIRMAVKKADEYGVTFPFARNSFKAFLFDNEVVLKLPDGSLVGATGQYKNDYLMQPIVLPYLIDLTFDDEGMATEYRPFPGILLTPKHEWGAPIVESCRYTVHTLVAAAQAEGSIEAAADMCGVSVEDVQAALKYEDILSGVV